MDATQSTVTGDAVSDFEALTQRTVTVTAKDAGSSNVGSGGEFIYVQITNECTKSSNFECTVVGGADNTISTPVFEVMTDNNDGTYSYSWTPDNEGTLSISVIRFNDYKILSTFYTTADLTGAVANTNYSSTISYDWESYNVTASNDDNVSAKFEAYLKAPVSGSVTLYMYTDSYAALWVDGTSEFNFMTTACTCERSTTVTMVAGQYYHIEAHWGDTTGAAEVDFRWSYTSQAKITVPTEYWYYPEYVGTSPYTVDVSCPSGYTGTNSSNPNVCSEI